MSRSRSSPPPPASPTPEPARRRWLLLVHQLPPVPSNLRVRTWRRLQGLGAVAIKQAVYVLPDTAEAREDFQWIKVEIEGSGGEAAVFSADTLDPTADAAMVDAFRRARQQDYAELGREIERARRAKAPNRPAPRSRGPRDQLARLRGRFAAIERLDFFSSAGRDRVAALLESFDGPRGRSAAEREAVTGSAKADRAGYQQKLWVTRPRPGIDRVGSAWLIRRFIDPKARFGFVTDAKAAPEASIPFDMFGAGFGHEGDRCTFEGLQSRFDIRDPAVKRLGELVHDLDLKDGRFGAPEAPTIEAAIDGLRLSHSDDHALLEQGIALFEALYRSFAQTKRQPGAAAKKNAKRSRNAPRRHRSPTT